MHSANALLPAVALVAVTAAVWVRLYVVRIGEMRRNGIAPQSLATSPLAGAALKDVRASDNFRNLFEVPVLFYVLCLALAVTDTHSRFLDLGPWLYVALRAVHSAIHCSYNRVMHRFAVYASSTVLLFCMWGSFGSKLLQINAA